MLKGSSTHHPSRHISLLFREVSSIKTVHRITRNDCAAGDEVIPKIEQDDMVGNYHL